MRSSMYSLLFLLCVIAASSSAKSNEPRKDLAFFASSLPRGGAAGDNDNSNTPPPFGKQLQQYEHSMKNFLNHYEEASVHMKQVLEKTLAFHDKTNGAMNDLEQGLFKVSIQLSMLPSDLSKPFQLLHHNMVVLQKAATTMIDQLGLYIELVTKCLQLVEGLVSEVQDKSSKIPQIKKDERKLKRNAKKYAQLQHRVQEDMIYLQQISVSVREEVLGMDARGKEEVWPTFLENVKAVHEAALNVDRVFRAIRDGSGSGSNNASLLVSQNTPPTEGTAMSGHFDMDHDDGVQELEVEMTTYEYSW